MSPSQTVVMTKDRKKKTCTYAHVESAAVNGMAMTEECMTADVLQHHDNI